MVEELCRIARDEWGVVEIRLNRPEVHNAFNDQLIGELKAHLRELESDDGLRLLLLTGEGRSFCAGADLRWMKKMKEYSPQQNYEDSLALEELFALLDSCPVPVLAKCHGAALGGGAGLLAVCDFVLAAEEAQFAFTEVTLGLVPAVISPYVIAKIGISQARAYFLSGLPFKAYRALEMGLVHQVVPLEELEEEWGAIVESFLKAAPEASRSAKELVKKVHGWPSSERKSLRDFTCQEIAERRVSAEGQEGMEALLEKRGPSWAIP